MVAERVFGAVSGRLVHLLTIEDGPFSVELISYGAAVRALRVPTRHGAAADICLGYDTLEEYIARDGYFGAVIGRNANRIGGARFVLNGREYRLSANEGENQLHGGFSGFDAKVWDYAVLSENSVVFSLRSPDGEEGFPGSLKAEAAYTLNGGALTIDYRAEADADTVANLTNHAYFNLGGHDGGPVGDHVLTLRASRYTPCGPGNIPTGEIAPVAGTVFDLRGGDALSARWDDPALKGAGGYDHNFALDAGDGPSAELYCPRTGVGLTVTTTLPGLQLYTAGFMSERPGKAGAAYGPRHGICLETQYYPDSVNRPAFPSPVLRAGEVYRSSTRYGFYVK